VIISYERAVVQAQGAGHPLEQEIELLVVHGILHLLGHDHTDPDQKVKMWAAQSEILTRLGNPISP
jgi:probable rRNA maturation factor